MDRTTPFLSGVGISLTATYGTVSTRYEDGSFRDIARVDGSDRYIQMMQRLSSPSAKHPCDPHFTMEDLWDDAPRQAWRSLRKRLGLPASSDVRILSDTIKSLLDTVASYHPLTSPQSAIISYPGLVALYNEDIIDSAEYLGVVALEGNHRYQPREIVAAYAGHGMGLCQNYTDKEKCKCEGIELPIRDALLVEYTERALLLHSDYLREASDEANPDIKAAASFDLGSDNSGGYGHAERVKNYVLELLRPRHRVFPSQKEILVIMTGSTESVGDMDIQKAVEAAVKELELVPIIRTSMPEYVASRGAAELAWRALSLRNRVVSSLMPTKP